jgi:glycosyltransferase involved in cell wall biosynthesis
MKQKLKIAQVAPVATSIPAPKGGSVESVTALLTEELVRRGHDVTLFATGNTVTSAKLHATFPHGYWQDQDMWPWEHYEMVNLAAACERAADFDVIHYQAAYYPMSTAFSRLIRTPMVQSIHHQPPPEQVALWKYHAESNWVAISEYQRSAMAGLNCVGVVPHGLDMANFPLSNQAEDYLVFLGRFTYGKGILQAIEVARRVGLPLLMAAPENDYYYEEVKQHVDGKWVQYLGELNQAEKTALLGGAKAMLYPMQLPEPFGLVLIEAMACGTPVAALNLGAVPEIVCDGVSGFVSATLDELVASLPHVFALARPAVRDYVEHKFSVSTMTDGYVDAYERVVQAAQNKH